tara:strand:+ start:1474 stop:1725 length:252 start_codon:yes stop_codon:yes gene_type:complete
MSNLLEDELEWLDNNTHRYDSDLHASSVKENILKRYEIKELKAALKAFTDALPDSLENVGGGTFVSPTLPIQVFKDARKLLGD